MSGSGSGRGSMALGQVKVASPAAGGQEQQRAKEKSVLFHAPEGGDRNAEREVVIPEWKLRSLCTEHSLPPTIRGNLRMGGCF